MGELIMTIKGKFSLTNKITVDPSFRIPTLPLTTLQQFNEFEEKLAEEAFFAQMVSYFFTFHIRY